MSAKIVNFDDIREKMGIYNRMHRSKPFREANFDETVQFIIDFYLGSMATENIDVPIAVKIGDTPNEDGKYELAYGVAIPTHVGRVDENGQICYFIEEAHLEEVKKIIEGGSETTFTWSLQPIIKIGRGEDTGFLIWTTMYEKWIRIKGEFGNSADEIAGHLALATYNPNLPSGDMYEIKVFENPEDFRYETKQWW